MEQLNLSRRQVTAIGAAFAVLLLVGFWYKLNPKFHTNAYYKDAARLQAQEANIQADAKGRPIVVAAPPSDKAYQPESGKD